MNVNNVDYITGVFRGDNGENMVTHLYSGTFSDVGFPMCSRGWQRKEFYKNGKIKYYEYSIFRNNTSNAGICQVCFNRAIKGLAPIAIPSNKKYYRKTKTKKQ